jgi:hypothetical protein
VSRALKERGFSALHVPHIKARLRAVNKWPDGIAECVEAFATPAAVLSHYTAHLASRIDAPILALIREPEANFWSKAAFTNWPGDWRPKAIAKRLANAQARTMTRVQIPFWRPADVTPWKPLVKEITARFTLFPLERLDELVAYCVATYGLDLRIQHEKKGRRRVTDERREGLNRLLVRSDPLWFDRMLYDSVMNENNF